PVPLDVFKLLQLPVADDVSIVDARYPIDGGHRKVRLYRPPIEGPLPVVVFLHGGGWIGGSLDMYDEPCATLARRVGALVVAPDYRLAPEHPFPAAVDDTVAALRWAADHISEYGGDPERIVVAGESAGANPATVAARPLRDEAGPALRAQVLITPPVDFLAETESRRQFANGPILSMEAAERMGATYLGDPANALSPDASPARAADLSELPPTLVVTME